jgi:hypothetical protein
MGPKARMALVAACLASGAFSCSNALADQSTAPEVPTAAQEATLTPAEVTLLNSGGAVNVTMDPTTGDILSVSAAVSVSPLVIDISITDSCPSGYGCYLTDKVPYADEGFHGSAGTEYGTWDYRSGYSSGDYTVSACWSSGCGIEITAGSSVSFTSDVTGTSFTIY